MGKSAEIKALWRGKRSCTLAKISVDPVVKDIYGEDLNEVWAIEECSKLVTACMGVICNSSFPRGPLVCVEVMKIWVTREKEFWANGDFSLVDKPHLKIVLSMDGKKSEWEVSADKIFSNVYPRTASTLQGIIMQEIKAAIKKAAESHLEKYKELKKILSAQ